jgi:hypothetical protein
MVAIAAAAGGTALAGDPPAGSVTGWTDTTFRASLRQGSSLALAHPMEIAPDIDFGGGRKDAAPGMSEQTVFFRSFLTPRLNARLSEFRAVVDMDFARPLDVNPWTRSSETEERVLHNATRAGKSAIKRYALERLNLTGWSLPLGSPRARGLDAFRTDSGGPRLRFGISHRAPRVEAMFPLDRGRVTVSADPLGRVGTWFESNGGHIRFGIALDPREETAVAGFTVLL